MTAIRVVLPVQQRAGFWRLVGKWVADHWRAARAREQSRRYIVEMDDRMLSDIGTSRSEALFQIDHGTGRGRRQG